MDIQEVQIREIQIGERHRKDLGDIEGLAHSIEANEMFHPIGVTSENELIFGLRRLFACRDISDKTLFGNFASTSGMRTPWTPH